VRADGARAGIVVLALLASGCATLFRPEGDGGWERSRRDEERTRRATAARVPLDGQVVAEPRPPSGVLTLPTALALAATGNRRIAEAGRDIEIAAARVREARAGLLPSTTASGRYNWYTDVLTNRLPVSDGAVGIDLPEDVVIREDEVGTAGAVLSQPIDLSGELRHVLEAAQAGYRGERARAWAVTLDEQVAVTRAYFGLLEEQRLFEVVEQRLVVQRTQLANAQARFDAGRLTKNELLVVQVTLRNTEQQRLRRELGIDRARWTLNAATGLPIGAPTAVADVTDPPVLPPLDEVLRETMHENPVLTGLQEEQQRLEHGATALARARLPRFAGGGTVDYSSQDIVEPQTVGAGFVGFSWDLGTDGRREAALAAARIAADRNRLVVEREMRVLEQTVRATYQVAEERLAALATARGAVVQAEENLRIREEQFEVGRATSDDVLDAEALLARERASAANALYQAHARRAELQQLVGRSVDTLYTEAR
jgi:outer membrane protein